MFALLIGACGGDLDAGVSNGSTTPGPPSTSAPVSGETHEGQYHLGTFALKLTAIDGQEITDTFPSFSGGQILESEQQFQ